MNPFIQFFNLCFIVELNVFVHRFNFTGKILQFDMDRSEPLQYFRKVFMINPEMVPVAVRII